MKTTDINPKLRELLAVVKQRLNFATKNKPKRFLTLLALFILLSIYTGVQAQINEGSTPEEISNYAEQNKPASAKQLSDFQKSSKQDKVFDKGAKIELGYLDEGGAFTAFMNDMVKFAKNGMSSLKSAVKGLLVGLILIDFIITVSHWALSDQNRLGDLFWKFIKWGIYVWIVGNFADLADTFLNGFMTIGKAIGGGDATLLSQPSDIFTVFYNTTVHPLLDYCYHIEFNFSDPVAVAKMILKFQHFPVIALCVFFIAIIQLVLIVLLAAQVVSTVAIYWFSAAIGFILFPFMMLEQTRFLAGNVISALMGGGARMAVLTAVIGLGYGIVANAITSFASITSDSVLLIALKITAYLALFCWASIKLPNVVAAAVAGHGGGGMGIASGITRLATIGR